jgi:hypothetical protein
MAENIWSNLVPRKATYSLELQDSFRWDTRPRVKRRVFYAQRAGQTHYTANLLRSFFDNFDHGAS